MNGKVRKILGGMSTAGLILAGSMPLMAQWDPPSTCTRAKSKKVESSKDKSAAKKKIEKEAPAKTAPAKEKSAQKSTK